MYWKESADKDFEVAEGLAKLGHYAYALFFCHLALEKMLKAAYVARHKKHAPLTHNLVSLAQDAELAMTPLTTKDFAVINEFNVQTRYPDKKSQFYREFNTREYAKEYLAKTTRLLSWLKEQLNRK
jgi:HEPN domain-containing protein